MRLLVGIYGYVMGWLLWRLVNEEEDGCEYIRAEGTVMGSLLLKLWDRWVVLG